MGFEIWRELCSFWQLRWGGAYCAHYYRYGLVGFCCDCHVGHFRIGIFDLMHGFVYLVLVGVGLDFQFHHDPDAKGPKSEPDI